MSDRVGSARSLLWTLVAFGLVAAVSATVLALVWRYHPRSESLEFEVAKASMQVLGVVFLGGLVTIATFLFQQDRISRAEAERKRREEWREDWRRDVDKRLDERRRQDELLRSVLDQTVAAYNSVKRIRRLLEAQSGGARMLVDIYDRHLIDLNDQQLTFESLKRTAPLIDKRLQPNLASDGEVGAESRSLPCIFGQIENYLNEVIEEYQEKRHLVAAAENGLLMVDLPKVNSFIRDTGAFQAAASREVREVVEWLQRALLTPLQLPVV